VTIPDIKDDPQAVTAFYLTQLFALQLDAYDNGSTPFIPDKSPFSSNLPAIPTTVNALLFICLNLNLFSAILALLVQQWTRQYLMLTHSLRFSSNYRARVRKVFGSSVQKSPIIWAVLVSMNSLFLSMNVFLFAISLYLLLLDKPVYICFYTCSIVCVLICAFIHFMHTRALQLSFFVSIPSLQVVQEKFFWKSTMEIDDHIVDQIFDALRPENSDLVRFGDEKIKMKKA
jgi:hypothetical protein